MDEIILVGTGGHTRSCIDVIELLGYYEIRGLVDKDKRNRQENMGYPILGTDDDLRKLRQKYRNALITIGQIKSPITRIKLFQRLQEFSYQLPFIVSPRAYVSKRAQIGDGTIVMHDAIVSTNAKVGKNCIINSKVLIEHDAIIGDHCHIATGAIVNGGVAIGNESFIGSGTILKQSICIGKNCVIGAGMFVKKDIEPDKVILKGS